MGSMLMWRNSRRGEMCLYIHMQVQTIFFVHMTSYGMMKRVLYLVCIVSYFSLCIFYFFTIFYLYFFSLSTFGHFLYFLHT